MKELEIMLTEAHQPLSAEHVLSKKDKDHLAAPSFNDGMDINSLLYNLFYEFGTCYTTYGIRLPIDPKEWSIKSLIIFPDMIKNNVQLVGGHLEKVSKDYVVKLTFNGYCRGCKITFFVDAEKKEEGD